MRRAVFVAIIFCLTESAGQADEIVWAGGGSGTWNTFSNWVGGNVPASTDSVSLKGWAPLVRTGWTVTATNTSGSQTASLVKDGHISTYWWSGAAMNTNMYVQIDLGSTQTFGGLDLNENLNGTDYPRGYDIYVSSDAVNWGSPIFTNNAGTTYDQNAFSDQTARYIRIRINTNAFTNWWAISELTVWGTAGDTQLATGAMTATSSTSYSNGLYDGPAYNALDFDYTSRFTTGTGQAIGQWFNVTRTARPAITRPATRSSCRRPPRARAQAARTRRWRTPAPRRSSFMSPSPRRQRAASGSR
jgi:hypothetical protein